jgi:microcystin degradation protein MlrC
VSAAGTPVARVALLGLMLESNAFAPVAREEDFRGRLYLEGRAILDGARRVPSLAPLEVVSFVRAMDATGPWEPVPILLGACQPWGPVEEGFFERCLVEIETRLGAAQSLDGVYVANHGAMTSTDDPDPDGAMLARVRAAVGPRCPVLATLDLHANLSRRMVDSATALIGYQTNPHVDMLERGEEAAHLLRAILAGQARPVMAYERLPLTPASVTLLTAGGPYGELMDYAQRRRREHGGQILNVTVLGGFVFSDTPENGLAVVVTGRDERAPAAELAREIAARAWAQRERFIARLTPVSDAVALALRAAADPAEPARIFADSGDNPGGGGTGTATGLLEALLEARAAGVLYGSFFDPLLAAEAHALGAGARFTAVFNRQGEREFARRLKVPARVVSVCDGDVVGRRGKSAGRRMQLGPSCALALGEDEGVQVVVISARDQTADPVFFEMLDLEVGAARTVCVKSRGHFRAGFDLWFAPEHVVEVDTTGLTSPVLERIEWRGLPRPVYPLDQDATWEPQGAGTGAPSS